MKTIRNTTFILSMALAALTNTVAAKNLPGTSKESKQYRINTATAPIAYDVIMTPLVQASIILPLNASSQSSNISAYTLQTIPSASHGILSIDMDGVLVPVSEGMMLTTDLASKLVFEPDTSYTGNVVFTYSAADDEGVSSNIANYTIPVIAKQQAVLPVSLLGFTGAAENKMVQLYWQTQNEGNSSHFEIQRSTDGNNFETIAMVTAKGNINTANNYQTKDDLFFYNYQSVYYRLKMIDINGSFKYSNSILIKLKAATKNNITAWPLPFTSNLNIGYYSEVSETVKITIHSINGSVLMTLNSNVKKGTNTISLYQAQQIPAGTYLLSVGNSTKAQTIKVIKQ
jgi:hypothetical protein